MSSQKSKEINVDINVVIIDKNLDEKRRFISSRGVLSDQMQM